MARAMMNAVGAQVRALLASLPGKTRAMVLDLCKVDLEGLQLDVYDDVAVAGA